MILNVSLTTVYCLDQSATRDFYVNKLGFQPGTDATVGDGFRWVTISHVNGQVSLAEAAPVNVQGIKQASGAYSGLVDNANWSMNTKMQRALDESRYFTRCSRSTANK